MLKIRPSFLLINLYNKNIYKLTILLYLKAMISIDQKFPEFSLTGVVSDSSDTSKSFQEFTDKSFPGKWKIIFFWPKDFTFICPTEMIEFGKMHSKFQEHNAELLGASIDSDFVHLAWRQNHKQLKDLSFPMLSDITRSLSNSLGILDEKAGVTKRATFIINPEGVVKFIYVTDLSVGRNPAEVLRVLKALQTEKLCPVNWQEGDATLD